MKDHTYYMNIALSAAKKAAKAGEVPVGCVIVKDEKIIAVSYNLREKRKNPLYHAEILAIKKAAKKLHSWRLTDCQIYITLEPCPMCAGAIINARIPTVVFGAYDKKAGCFGSVFDFRNDFNHHPEIIAGILEDECSDILKQFFSLKRK